MNNRVQKILWYNKAWIIHKQEGQNYFNKMDDVSLPHPLLALEKVKRNILERFYFNMSFRVLMKKIHFSKVLSHFCQNMVSNQKNSNFSLIDRAIRNIFFCFKVLNESKLLSEWIFLI